MRNPTGGRYETYPLKAEKSIAKAFEMSKTVKAKSKPKKDESPRIELENNSLAQTSQIPEKSDNKKIKALVVEDFKTMRKMVIKVLDSLNVHTIEAANGLEALEKLEKETVDMVFTDLVMPEMDGFELCEEIRRRDSLRALPVIVISTHRDAKYVIQALRGGADDYLTKPFTAPLANRVIERVLSYV